MDEFSLGFSSYVTALAKLLSIITCMMTALPEGGDCSVKGANIHSHCMGYYITNTLGGLGVDLLKPLVQE